MTTTHSRKKSNDAVSPVIATVAMIGLVITCLSIVMLTLVGVTIDSAQSPPVAHFQASANSTYVYLTGGDPLLLENLIFYDEEGGIVNVVFYDGDNSLTGGFWYPGQYAAATDGNISIITVNHNGNDYLIYRATAFSVLPVGSMVPDWWEIPEPGPAPEVIPGYTIDAISWQYFKNVLVASYSEPYHSSVFDENGDFKSGASTGWGWKWADVNINYYGHTIFFDPADNTYWVVRNNHNVPIGDIYPSDPTLQTVYDTSGWHTNMVNITGFMSNVLYDERDIVDSNTNIRFKTSSPNVSAISIGTNSVTYSETVSQVPAGTLYEYEGLLYASFIDTWQANPNQDQSNWRIIGYNSSKLSEFPAYVEVNQHITQAGGTTNDGNNLNDWPF